MERGLCAYCHIRPVRFPRRKYCDEHAKISSLLWKRRHRQQWKASGDPYWTESWKNKTDDERRAYFRDYMRRYRLRRRSDCRALDE
jgi:hypothetical protein